MTDTPIQKAGEVEFDEFFITNQQKENVDITQMMAEIGLYEDIFSPFMHGYIVLSDAKDLINNFGIQGGEGVTIKFRSKTLPDEPHLIIEKSFAIYAIEDRALIDDRQSTYKLKFCSWEAFADGAVTIKGSIPTEGRTTSDQMASKIWEDYVSRNRRVDGEEKTELFISNAPHKREFQYLSNSWSPMQNMAYIARMACTEDDISDFVFFESNKAFYLTSLSNLINNQLEQPFDEYSFITDGQAPLPKDKSIGYTNDAFPDNPEMSQINDITIPRTIDILDSQLSGHYANNTITYDFFAKTKGQFLADVRRDFPYYGRTDAGIPVPAGVPRDSFSVTNIKYVNGFLSLNRAGGFPSDGAEPYKEEVNPAFTLSDSIRQQYMSSFKDYTFELVVPGRTDIEVGRVINLNYPLAGEKQSGEEYLDPFLAGSYLVTAIKHEWTFTDYKMRMEIVKNGLMYSMGDAEDEVNLYEN